MKLIMSQFPVRRIAMDVPKAVFVNCNLPSNFLEANMLLSFIKYHLINLSTNVTKFVLGWLFLCCTNDSWQLILYCWKNCVTFERKTHLWVEQQCMWVVPMKILSDPLCQFQTAHPAVVALVVGFFWASVTTGNWQSGAWSAAPVSWAHAMLYWSEYSPCHRATSNWCSSKPSCSNIWKEPKYHL